VLTRLRYLVRETLLGLRRGGWMNGAAISTVMVLLLLLGLGLQTTWQLDRLVNQFGSQLELSVFLSPGVEGKILAPQLAKLPHVESLSITTKEAAWQTLIDELGLAKIKGATEQLNGNPLVDEIRVKVDRPDAVPTTATRLKTLRGIDEVAYVPEVLQQLNQLNRGLRTLGLGLVGLLSLAALAVITTTVKLIVLARRREVEIMQLVGATSGWISMPFMVQGLTFGLVGGGAAWGMLLLTQRGLTRLISQQPDFVQLLAGGQLSLAQQVQLPLILLGFGGTIGLLGSWFAVRRALR
jgi:cell division transport system permease protein